MISISQLRSELASLGDDCLEMADNHACEEGPEFEAAMRKLRLAVAEARPAILKAKADISRMRRLIAADAADEARDDRRYGTMADQHRHTVREMV